jgi:hypothetical protein
MWCARAYIFSIKIIELNRIKIKNIRKYDKEYTLNYNLFKVSYNKITCENFIIKQDYYIVGDIKMTS